MKLLQLTKYWNGWVAGEFEDSLIKTKDMEVSIRRYSAGDSEKRHIHPIAIEFTIIVSGKVRMNGVEFFRDDIVVIEPGESTDFYAVSDAVTVCLKSPSLPGTDKVFVEQ